MRVVVAVMLVVALAACTGTVASPGTSTSPAGSASASVGATVVPTTPAESSLADPSASTPAPSASSAPAPPPFVVGGYFSGPYLPDTAVRVTVDGLRVRAEPTTKSHVIGTLARDDVLLLAAFPIHLNDRVWYYADRVGTRGTLPPLPASPRTLAPEVSGWVAVWTTTAEYVAAMPGRCPATVDLANLAGMLRSERLPCFANRTIELEGVFGCGGCGGTDTGTYDPGWLAATSEFDLLSVDPKHAIGPFALHFPPGGQQAPKEGSILRVRGHFDDPVSLRCVITDLDNHDVRTRFDTALAVGSCRQAFVLERYEILGTYPDFPS